MKIRDMVISKLYGPDEPGVGKILHEQNSEISNIKEALVTIAHGIDKILETRKESGHEAE